MWQTFDLDNHKMWKVIVSGHSFLISVGPHEKEWEVLATEKMMATGKKTGHEFQGWFSPLQALGEGLGHTIIIDRKFFSRQEDAMLYACGELMPTMEKTIGDMLMKGAA